MPELPEVEACRINIKPYLINQVINYIIVRNINLRWPVSPEILQIKNQSILSIKRRAKYLLIQLKFGWIVMHFGMSGRLSLLSRYIPPQKHDHIDIVMKNQNILRYTDQRRFGACLWISDLSKNVLFKNLGLEPLTDTFNNVYLSSKICLKKNTIKQSIMDNKIVVGVGNIYANESLFAAGIIPSRISMNLSNKEVKFLVCNIKSVLLKAIKHGGTTLSNFLQSNGEPGYFTQQLKVYGRANEPCLICGTKIIKCKYASRSSYWCPECQL
ncbi:bifunctional DNA-formamidopyrimidine glycosylase/DNA-(apurinic or apyrimidinic site) lyase [Pantoea sp. SoEX]|uniref:bifunctional DNA-formamidopyrimidine glycosylase/DNA-(apurinic or apyrimidinic site) lyase n=1 Tax=Pantoea sp. SoEX TaxID=2576763 RepID=UPI00135CBCD8|nr:bifunctional DNA-formamidopyrimidine glycosylase/DNA-(apurinic or apyrimidinic site) lyase [Pantoea sp. SoEX]MXP51392.1 bifunctional DNA-formamidopyrimidine glycosylase/DNA-(apurinic or apyrimidinic site) lyase [Pantoea sp. SoEX]